MTVPSSATAETWLVQLPEFRFFASFWGSMLAVDVGRVVSPADWVPTLLVACTIAACSVGQGPTAVAASALIGWLFVTGFVVNADGALALTGTADLGRLLLLLTCGALGAALRPTLTRS